MIELISLVDLSLNFEFEVRPMRLSLIRKDRNAKLTKLCRIQYRILHRKYDVNEAIENV